MPFDVNQANQSTKCRGGCGKTIPPRTPKLRFIKHLGVTVSGSLCRDCLAKFARQMVALNHEVYYEFPNAMERFAELVREQAEKGLEIESDNEPVSDVESWLNEVREDFNNGGYYAVIDTEETNVWLEEYTRTQGTGDSRIFLISIYPREFILSS